MTEAIVVFTLFENLRISVYEFATAGFIAAQRAPFIAQHMLSTTGSTSK